VKCKRVPSFLPSRSGAPVASSRMRPYEIGTLLWELSRIRRWAGGLLVEGRSKNCRRHVLGQPSGLHGRIASK
jgi:hypothetical protein